MRFPRSASEIMTGMTGKGSVAGPLLVACLGGVLVVLGLVIVGADISKWMDTGDWRSDSLLDLLRSPRVEPYLPEDFTLWLRHPRSLQFLHPGVVFMLDAVTQWVLCLALGAFIVWKGLK